MFKAGGRGDGIPELLDDNGGRGAGIPELLDDNGGGPLLPLLLLPVVVAICAPTARPHADASYWPCRSTAESNRRVEESGALLGVGCGVNLANSPYVSRGTLH